MAETGLKPTNAYFAGYLDADGCVRFSRGTPRVEIKSVFPWILTEFSLNWGGAVRLCSQPPDRNLWRWGVCGDSAEKCLIDLVSDLYVKQEQAHIVLQARRVRPGPYRDGLVEQLKALKHRNFRYND